MSRRLNMPQKQFYSIQSTINRKVVPKTTTCLNSFLVNIITAKQQGRIICTLVTALLQLEWDRLTNNKLIRMYAVDGFSLLVQIQLYHGFQKYYNQKKTIVHILDNKNDTTIQFKRAFEAIMMKDRIIQNCPTIIYKSINQDKINLSNHAQEVQNKENESQYEWSLLGSIVSMLGFDKQDAKLSHKQSKSKLTSVSSQPSISSFVTAQDEPQDFGKVQIQTLFESVRLAKKQKSQININLFDDSDIFGSTVDSLQFDLQISKKTLQKHKSSTNIHLPQEAYSCKNICNSPLLYSRKLNQKDSSLDKMLPSQTDLQKAKPKSDKFRQQIQETFFQSINPSKILHSSVKWKPLTQKKGC